MITVSAEARSERQQRLRREIPSIYGELTDGLRRPLRVLELVHAAGERHPDLVPTRAAVEADQRRPLKDRLGLEIDQGVFVGEVLAHPEAGFHLMHAMTQPRREAVAQLAAFQRHGSLDLGPMRVDREGAVGRVTIQNHAFLNAEDDASTSALEIAVDLVLLDDAIEVGVLRGGVATHPKYAGRRIFGAGINLTHLYQGRISLIEFMIERELGLVSKIYRGHGLGTFDEGELEPRREKPWIAAVEAFAIGGACQWLLVMDRVIAEVGSYFNLPARKDGFIPGCANLRLPRIVGERLARQAIFFDRAFQADSDEGRLLADEVVPSAEIGAAIERAAAELISAGTTGLLANRKGMRMAQEPLDLFRRYMSHYVPAQAHCLYSPALIENLERNWNAARRS
jgi:thioesterase DpgC